MTLVITDFLFGDISTISIPTDAILIVSLLIVFVVLGYFFNTLLNNQTNKLSLKTHIDSDIELVKKTLEDQLRFEETMLDEKSEKKTITKKLNFLPHSKLLGLSSLAILAMGGTSLLSLQNMQKSYESMKTSNSNIKLDNKSSLSIIDSKPLDKAQSNIREINYIHPFFSTIKNSKGNHYYQSKENQKEKLFSF